MMVTPQTSCFVGIFGDQRCHVEVRSAASGIHATPWLQHRFVLRPVLDTDGEQPQFAAATHGDAVQAGVEFLTRRFGSLEAPPTPCRDPRTHIKIRRIPVAWTEVIVSGSTSDELWGR